MSSPPRSMAPIYYQNDHHQDHHHNRLPEPGPVATFTRPARRATQVDPPPVAHSPPASPPPAQLQTPLQSDDDMHIQSQNNQRRTFDKDTLNALIDRMLRKQIGVIGIQETALFQHQETFLTDKRVHCFYSSFSKEEAKASTNQLKRKKKNSNDSSINLPKINPQLDPGKTILSYRHTTKKPTKTNSAPNANTRTSSTTTILLPP